jgi:hypothetical protein
MHLTYAPDVISGEFDPLGSLLRGAVAGVGRQPMPSTARTAGGRLARVRTSAFGSDAGRSDGSGRCADGLWPGYGAKAPGRRDC